MKEHMNRNEGTSTDNEFSTTSGSDSSSPDAIEGLSVTDKDDAEKTLTLSWNTSSASDFYLMRLTFVLGACLIFSDTIRKS